MTVRHARRLAMVSASAMVALLVTACGSGSDESEGGGQSAEPFRVLMLTAQSGPFGPGGKAQIQGLTAAANKFNEEKGGILGRKIEIQAVDTAGTAQNAVSHFQNALTGGNPPDLVWAGVSSDETLALCPLVARAGLISISQTAGDKVGNPQICPNHFSTALNASQVTVAMGTYMAERGWKKAALLTDIGAYGTSILDAAKVSLPKAGLEVVGEQQFESDAVDVTPQWRNLKGSGADVVVIEGQGPAIGAALNGRTNVGWDVDVLVAPGAVGSNPATIVRSPDVLSTATFFASAAAIEGGGTDRMQDAVEWINKAMEGAKYTNGRNIQALAWDALAIIETAARQANSTEPAKLKSALEAFGATPPADPTWISREKFGFTAQSHFSGPEGYAEPAKPAPLSDGGTLPAFTG